MTKSQELQIQEFGGIAGLADHVEQTHHEYVRRVTPHLVELANSVGDTFGDEHPELLRLAGLVRSLQFELFPHLLKEERVLFPMIRELSVAKAAPTFDFGSILNPIGVMADDHDVITSLFGEMRQTTKNHSLPDGANAAMVELYQGLEQLEADTIIHTEKEDELLFPAAMALEAELVAAAQLGAEGELPDEAGPTQTLRFGQD